MSKEIHDIAGSPSRSVLGLPSPVCPAPVLFTANDYINSRFCGYHAITIAPWSGCYDGIYSKLSNHEQQFYCEKGIRYAMRFLKDKLQAKCVARYFFELTSKKNVHVHGYLYSPALISENLMKAFVTRLFEYFGKPKTKMDVFVTIKPMTSLSWFTYCEKDCKLVDMPPLSFD